MASIASKIRSVGPSWVTTSRAPKQTKGRLGVVVVVEGLVAR